MLDRLAPPRGPRGLPLIGVGPRFKRDPLGFIVETAREYGDVSYFRVGLRRVFLVNRPQLIEEVLIHSPTAFAKPVTPGEECEVEPMAALAIASMKTWVASAPLKVMEEAKRLFPPPAIAPDPNQEPRSQLEVLAETTADAATRFASAFTWTLIALARHPDAQERIRADAAQVSLAVCEALRLYPPVWTAGRVVRTQFRLFNYLMPKGSVCLMSPFVTHRLTRYWPHPETFDAERFRTVAMKDRPRFAYFPFGDASAEPVTEALNRVVAAIVGRWRLGLAPGDPLELAAAGPILWPRNPVNLTVSPC